MKHETTTTHKPNYDTIKEELNEESSTEIPRHISK